MIAPAPAWPRLAATAAMLLLCWPAWWLAGWVVERLGPGVGTLLVQACLFILLLGLADHLGDRLAARFRPDASGEHHG